MRSTYRPWGQPTGHGVNLKAMGTTYRSWGQPTGHKVNLQAMRSTSTYRSWGKLDAMDFLICIIMNINLLVIPESRVGEPPLEIMTKRSVDSSVKPLTLTLNKQTKWKQTKILYTIIIMLKLYIDIYLLWIWEYFYCLFWGYKQTFTVETLWQSDN